MPARTSRAAAASYRRQLRSRQQRVADPRQRPCPGRHQDEVEPQRQSFAQRQQLQGHQHGGRNRRCDVQTADRQQVRQAAAPHRFGILLNDAVLVAGGKGNGDPGRPLGKARGNVRAQAAAGAFQASLPRRCQDGWRVQRLPHRSDSLEPGVPGEIIGAGQRHPRRRRQPGAHLNSGPAREPGRHVFVGDGNPDLGRQRRSFGPDQQAQRLLGRKVIDCLDPPGDLGDHRPLQPWCPDPLRPRPHQGAAERRRQRKPAKRTACAPAAHAKPASDSAAAVHRKPAQCAGCPSVNHAAMPLAKPTTSQGGSWARSASRRRSTASICAKTRSFQ
jgi:hypothetical protein